MCANFHFNRVKFHADFFVHYPFGGRFKSLGVGGSMSLRITQDLRQEKNLNASKLADKNTGFKSTSYNLNTCLILSAFKVFFVLCSPMRLYRETSGVYISISTLSGFEPHAFLLTVSTMLYPYMSSHPLLYTCVSRWQIMLIIQWRSQTFQTKFINFIRPRP